VGRGLTEDAEDRLICFDMSSRDILNCDERGDEAGDDSGEGGPSAEAGTNACVSLSVPNVLEIDF
jgi:hypothetical protein